MPSDIALAPSTRVRKSGEQRVDHLGRHVRDEAHPAEQPDRTRQTEFGEGHKRMREAESSIIGGSDVSQPFDAVLMIAFGGPQAPPDIRPFLANVLRGRRVAEGRVEEVAHHYEVVGGRSPITELTLAQAEGLRSAPGRGRDAAARVRRHAQLASVPRRHARGDVEGRRPARGGLHRRRAPQLLELHAVPRERPGRACPAGAGRTARCRGHVRARLVRPSRCSSTPTLSACREATRQGRAAATARSSSSRRTAFRSRWPRGIPIARSSRRPRGWSSNAHRRRGAYVTVYQSRSGRPDDPWLGPDVCDYLREARARGLEAAILSPIGFRLRPRRSALRPRRRSAVVPARNRLADGPCAGGQRPSAVSRHDGRRRAPRVQPLRPRAPARTGAAYENDVKTT